MKFKPFDLLNKIRGKEQNPFSELTREERIERAKKEIEVKEGIKRLGILCQDILNDKRYIEFADIFKTIEQQITELMVFCDIEDRDKFFLKMREYQIKLRMFKQILRVPHEFVEEYRKIDRTEVK